MASAASFCTRGDELRLILDKTQALVPATFTRSEDHAALIGRKIVLTACTVPHDIDAIVIPPIVGAPPAGAELAKRRATNCPRLRGVDSK